MANEFFMTKRFVKPTQNKPMCWCCGVEDESDTGVSVQLYRYNGRNYCSCCFPFEDWAEKTGECDECGKQGTVYLDGKDWWICEDCLLTQYEDGDDDD